MACLTGGVQRETLGVALAELLGAPRPRVAVAPVSLTDFLPNHVNVTALPPMHTMILTGIRCENVPGVRKLAWRQGSDAQRAEQLAARQVLAARGFFRAAGDDNKRYIRRSPDGSGGLGDVRVQRVASAHGAGGGHAGCVGS